MTAGHPKSVIGVTAPVVDYDAVSSSDKTDTSCGAKAKVCHLGGGCIAY
jgi:hypothetical protein